MLQGIHRISLSPTHIIQVECLSTTTSLLHQLNQGMFTTFKICYAHHTVSSILDASKENFVRVFECYKSYSITDCSKYRGVCGQTEV